MSNINKTSCVKGNPSAESSASSNATKKSELSSLVDGGSGEENEEPAGRFPKEIQILGLKNVDSSSIVDNQIVQGEKKLPYINRIKR